MFTITWIYWYTLTWTWRSSQKLLTRWSGWGFNFKAQVVSDRGHWCSCNYGPGKDMCWLQRKQNCVLPVWLWPKMSLHLNLCNLPGEAGEPTGNPLQKCLENADSLKWSFPQSQDFCLLEKESGLQDEVSHHHTRVICSAQSSSRLAGRVPVSVPVLLSYAETQHSSCQFNIPMTSSLASPCQALVCAPFFGFN